MLGTLIGNFRVASLLGRGGMGEVYVAEHVGISTRVAVKVLLPEISKHEDHVHRLFNEARIVSRIKHAGIAKIFDVGFHEGQAYLVMEFLEGEALAQRISRHGRLSIGELADFGRQVASVLSATHASGVTHRDLKPDNIFLVSDEELERRERVKVLDFGIAKLPGNGGPRTIGTMGTPEYMAPEQWGDSGSVDWRADAYSLGCVLFEMATGRPPFPSSTIAEAYTQHTQAVAPSVRALRPEMPVEIDRLIQQLLAKAPAMRCESMMAVARALEPWASSTAPSAPSGAMDREPTVPRAVTTLGGGVGQVVRVDSVKSFGVVVALGAIATIAAIALISGRGRESRGAEAVHVEPAAVREPRVEPVAAPPPAVAEPRVEPPRGDAMPPRASTALPAPAKRKVRPIQPAKAKAPVAPASTPPAPTPPPAAAAPIDELAGRT